MSRRSLLRQIGNPASLFHEQSYGRNDPKWSMFRVILFGMFVWWICQDAASLGKLSGPSVALAACIIFGLAVRDLFAKVPVAESLGALQAFFGNVMGKAAAAVESRWGLTGPANDGAPGGDDF
jgi:hypothetical protein